MQKPYYEKPKFKLYQANCLDILSEFPENSVDMVFADPPYLLSNGGFTVHAGRRVSVDKGEWDKSKGFKVVMLCSQSDIIFSTMSLGLNRTHRRI